MAPPSHFGWPRLATGFLLFLSLLAIANASPLPEDHVNTTLVTRGAKPDFEEEPETQITRKQYLTYLEQNWPLPPNHYMLFTAYSKLQAAVFAGKNSHYMYYGNMIDTPKDPFKKEFVENPDHPWHRSFDKDEVVDDADAASEAIAMLSRNDVLLFGGLHYATLGEHSFFTTKELKHIRDGMRDGRVNRIVHMKEEATGPAQIVGYEGVDGIIHFEKGYDKTTKNASGKHGDCRAYFKALLLNKNAPHDPDCDAPREHRRKRSSSESCEVTPGASASKRGLKNKHKKGPCKGAKPHDSKPKDKHAKKTKKHAKKKSSKKHTF